MRMKAHEAAHQPFSPRRREGTRLPAEPQARSAHTRTAVTVLVVCVLLNLIGRGTADTYVVFLLPLEQDLGWTRSDMTSVYSIYLLVTGLSSPIVGMLFDRFGPRVLYTSGIVALAGAYLLAPQVQTPWQFYATIGAMTGISAAALGLVPSSSLISRWFRERLSTAISVAFASLGLGRCSSFRACNICCRFTAGVRPIRSWARRCWCWRRWCFSCRGSAMP